MSGRSRALQTMVVIAFTALGVANASADAIFVQNHSFEVGVPQDGNPLTVGPGDDYVIGLPAGWSGTQGVLSTRAGSYFDNILADSPDPNDNNENAWSNGGIISQVLSATLQPNSLYTLTVDVGWASDVQTFVGEDVRLGTGFNDVQTLLTPDSGYATPAPPMGGWTTWTRTYTTGGSPGGLGQPIRIELVNKGVQTQFDNVRLSVQPTPVPLPAAVWAGMLLLGCAAIVKRVQRTGA